MGRVPHEWTARKRKLLDYRARHRARKDNHLPYTARTLSPKELEIEVYEESVPLDALHRASFSLADMVDDGQPIPREYADAEPLPGLMGHDWQGRAGPRKQPGALRCRRCAITWHEHRAYPVECCRRN